MGKIKVYMGLMTMGSVVDSQAYLIRELQAIYGDHVDFVYPESCVRRMFHDFARNAVVEEFLQTDCDVLWFLDSDITPPKHLLDLLVLHYDKWDMSGAAYPVFMKPTGGDIPEILFTAYKKNPVSGNLQPSSVPPEGKEFVDGLATGCLFIKRHVFEKLEKPYFEFKYNPITRDLTEGEDLGFCRKANLAGMKFFTDFSMVCKHQKSVDLLDLNNYAIQYSNRSVLEYDSRIKELVETSVKAAYKKGFEDASKKLAPPQASKLVTGNSQTLWVPR